jgi:hypothetical protein
MAQSPKVTDADRLEFIMDRLAIFEQVVAGLARKAGASDAYVSAWTRHIANWPDVSDRLTRDAKLLLEWARTLK